MRTVSALLVLSLMSPIALAHEGHNHAGAEAPHGGVLKEGKQLNLELVTQGSDVLLYPLAKDGKAVALKDVQISATAQPPKKTKTKLDLKPMEDHFHGTFDAKGSYRYELQIEAKSSGKTDKFTYQVEPQG